jgi:hypothetical protein
MVRNAKNREKGRQQKPEQEPPLAGPHAKPELTDKDKTLAPGCCRNPTKRMSKVLRDEPCAPQALSCHSSDNCADWMSSICSE